MNSLSSMPLGGYEKEKNILIEYVKDENLIGPDNLKYSIYKIKNCRVFNDFVENVAIISGNKVIDKVSYQQVKGELKDANHNSVLYKGTPYLKKKINGRVLSLTQGASGHKNYFHWLYAILPKINSFILTLESMLRLELSNASYILFIKFRDLFVY